MSEEKTLRPDQIADLAWFMAHRKGLLLHDPGVGKTPTACVLQYWRWSRLGIRTLWIQPKGLFHKNRDELLTWTPFKPEDVAIIDRPDWQKRAGDAKVLILGPDRFHRLAGELDHFGAVDIDEWHMCFKGPGAARTVSFLNKVRRRSDVCIMSGTLISGELDSCWSAIHAIEPRYYPLGHAQFRAEHGVFDGQGELVAWRNHARIAQIFARHGLRRTFESVFGQQEIVTQLQPIEMLPQQRKLFDEMRETATLELEHAMVDGTLPGVALIRARQIMEHPERFPDPLTTGTIDLLKGGQNGKLAALEVHLEDHKRTGKPLVIFASLVEQQRLILELTQRLGLEFGWLGGHTSAAARGQISGDFIAGRLQGLIGSPPIAAVGYNWQFWGSERREVDHVIFASLPYLDTDYTQGVRRFIRQKRYTPLRVTVLDYIDSLDQRMREILHRKSLDAHRVDPSRMIVKFAA